MRSPRLRLNAVLVGVLLVALTACVDTLTAPPTPGKRALRDTTAVEGDPSLCRSGYHIINGRVVCDGDQ